MTTYYVGIGGSDVSSGASWDERWATINKAVDTALTAGDIIYVGPGTYRENVTINNPGLADYIYLIGDVTGEHTDGIGGMVRITASADDENTGGYPITTVTRYYSLQGFVIDGASSRCVYVNVAGGITIKDCIIIGSGDGSTGVHISCGVTCTQSYFQRNIFIDCQYSIYLSTGTWPVTANIDVTDNIFIGCAYTNSYGLYSIGSNTNVQGNTFWGGYCGVYGASSISNSGAFDIHNNSFFGLVYGIGQNGYFPNIANNYNNYSSCQTRYTNISGEPQETNYLNIYEMVLLLQGHKLGRFLFELWNLGVVARFGNPTTEDFYGLPRSVTSSERTAGATEITVVSRDDTDFVTNYPSLKLETGTSYTVRVPVLPGETIRVWLFHKNETGYTGSAPTMTIRGSGADRTTVGSTSTNEWIEMTDTFTLGDNVTFITIEMRNRSSNTPPKAVWFDGLEVTPV